MKSVGIKVLKNQLSRYLHYVREGGVVLVTDRDEVVAEIHAPSYPTTGRISAWAAFLENESRRGRIALSKRKRTQLAAPRADVSLDALRELELARQERE